MKFPILIIVVGNFLFTGCVQTKENLYGNYSYEGIYGVASELNLQEDSFKLKWQQGLNHGVILGTWKYDHKSIVLYNTSISGNTEFNVIKSYNITQSKILIEVYDEYLYPVFLATGELVVDNDTLIATSDTLGKIVFPMHKYKKLNIIYPGYNEITLIPSTYLNNYLVLQMFPKPLYQTFDSTIFLIKKQVIKSKSDFFMGKIKYRRSDNEN